MSRCVGRGNCSVLVEASVLGPASSCKPGTDLHAKATYACVSRQVLKGLFAAPAGSREDGGAHPRIPGKEEGLESDSQERGNALDAGRRVTEDYTGFVDAPRYVPEQELSSSRHYEEDEGSRRPTGNPFTQIRRLFRNEDQNRGKADPKSPATDDQAITGVISRNTVHERDTLTHQQLITRGVSFWVSLTSFMKGMSGTLACIMSSNNHLLLSYQYRGENESERGLSSRHQMMTGESITHSSATALKADFQSCTQLLIQY